jgi:hypothetical protein
VADVGTVTVKVVPDFSAFHPAAWHEIVAATAADLPGLTIADIQAVAEVVVQHFVSFPKAAEETPC